MEHHTNLSVFLREFVAVHTIDDIAFLLFVSAEEIPLNERFWMVMQVYQPESDVYDVHASLDLKQIQSWLHT